MKIRLNILYIVILLLTSSIYAQEPCPPFDPVCNGQPGLPIDGGLSLLLIAGTIFGVYKLKNK